MHCPPCMHSVPEWIRAHYCVAQASAHGLDRRDRRLPHAHAHIQARAYVHIYVRCRLMPIISIVLIVAYFFFIPKRDEFQLIQVGDVRMS